MLDFDLQNVISKRHSLSDTNAIAGFTITDRNMIASINPETQVETSYDFYGYDLTNQREQSYVVGTVLTITATKCNPFVPEFEDVGGIWHDKVNGEISQNTSNGYALELEWAAQFKYSKRGAGYVEKFIDRSKN